jgi:hypothetical protein
LSAGASVQTLWLRFQGWPPVSDIEALTVAAKACIVNGPGESKDADIGISLPGIGEIPAAPVVIGGQKAMAIRGGRRRGGIQADRRGLYRAKVCRKERGLRTELKVRGAIYCFKRESSIGPQQLPYRIVCESAKSVERGMTDGQVNFEAARQRTHQLI